MAVDWDNKQQLLGELSYRRDSSRVKSSQASAALSNVWTDHAAITDPNAKAAVGKLITAVQNNILAAAWLRYWDSGKIPPYGLLYFLKHLTIEECPEAEEYNLTWGKIVTAWTEADKEGRLWTVLTIDFMRKEVWDEPVSFFAMRTGAPE